ncbi:hypothetical protein HYW17_02130 [Candidatus Uhrbacteria bacterium]|nr:hypothetical protein [Candidatus Uhrbacteria bacterium]
MPTPKGEKKPTPEQPKGPETPEEVAVRVAGAVQAGKEKSAAAALAGAETEAPTAERAEQDPAAQAREIAQKYLDTIPEADRKLTDPKQVETLLYVLESTYTPPGSQLFANVDRLGNMPTRAREAFFKKDVKGLAQAWRDYADDPVGVAKEADKLRQIGASTLPESVRTALLSIILKEGDHSVVEMAKDAAAALEQTGDLGALKSLREKYLTPEVFKATSLRQDVARELLKGLYPDLMQREEVAFFEEMSSLPDEKSSDKNTVVAMVERYGQLLGDAPLSERASDELEGAINPQDVITKIQDGSIPEHALGAVISALQVEARSKIAQKATSAEKK